MGQIDDQNKSIGTMDELVQKLTKSLEGADKQANNLQKTIRSFSASVLQGVDAFKNLTNAIQYNQNIAEKLFQTYQKQIKASAEVQQSLYKQATLLKGMGSEYGSVSQAQDAYLNKIKEFRHETGLNQVASEKLMAAINKTFVGIRSEGSLNQLYGMQEALVKLTGNAEEAGAAFQQLSSAAEKYGLVARVLSDANKGIASNAKDLDNMKALVIAGKISMEQYQTIAQTRASLANTTGGKMDSEGRRDFTRSYEGTQNLEQQNIAKGIIGAQTTAVQKALDYGVSNAASAVGKAGINAYAQVAGDTAAGAESILRNITGGLSSVGGLGGRGGGKSPVGGGIGGGGPDYVGEGVTKVHVVNFGDMGGGGILGGSADVKAAADILAEKTATASASKLGKVLSVGSKLLSKAPVVGGIAGTAEALLSEGSMTEKITKGILVGGSTAIASALGTPAVGMIVGSAVSAYSDKIYHWGASFFEDKTKATKNADTNVNKELTKEGGGHGLPASDTTFIDKFKKVGDTKKETMTYIDQNTASAESFAKQASAYGTLIGYGDQQRKAMEGQAAELQKNVKYHNEMKNVYLDNASKATDEQERIQWLAEARKQEAEAMSASLSSLKLRTDAIKAEFAQKSEFAQSSTSEASAMKSLNEAKRLGMGQNYQDTTNVIKLLGQEVGIKKQEAKALSERAAAAAASGDTAGARAAALDAQKARTEALSKETEMYNQAKGIREGYLDALRSEVSTAGGYAELIPTMEKGIQMYEKSLKLGGTGVTGVSGPAKFTTSGLSDFNSGERQGLANKLLGGTANLIYGGNQDQAAVMESGVVPQIGRIAESTQKATTALASYATKAMSTGTESNPTVVRIKGMAATGGNPMAAAVAAGVKEASKTGGSSTPKPSQTAIEDIFKQDTGRTNSGLSESKRKLIELNDKLIKMGGEPQLYSQDRGHGIFTNALGRGVNPEYAKKFEEYSKLKRQIDEQKEIIKKETDEEGKAKSLNYLKEKLGAFNSIVDQTKESLALEANRAINTPRIIRRMPKPISPWGSNSPEMEATLRFGVGDSQKKSNFMNSPEVVEYLKIIADASKKTATNTDSNSNPGGAPTAF